MNSAVHIHTADGKSITANLPDAVNTIGGWLERDERVLTLSTERGLMHILARHVTRIDIDTK